MRNKLYFWVLFLASLVLFFAPITFEERVGLGLDKLVHLLLFAGLFYLGTKQGILSLRSRMTAFLLVYAVVVEFIQGEYLPFRNFDVLDIVADYVGLGLAVFFTSPALRASSPKSERE